LATIEVKKFKAEDFVAIAPHAIDVTARYMSEEWLLERGKLYEKCHCAFTGWWGDKPLGSLGIWTVREGVGNMFSVLHEDVRKHVRPSMRAVKMMLDIIEEIYDFKKLRSDSRMGFPESQRFLEFLGFKKQRRNMNKTHYFYRRYPCRQQQQQ
jgi:hypothetical protein